MTTTLYYGVGAPILAAGVAGMMLAIAKDPRKGVLVALSRPEGRVLTS